MTAIPASKPRVISWYRSPLDSSDFKKLHERSDLLGGFQTLGYLGLLVATGAGVLIVAPVWPVWATLLLLFLHGTFTGFMINAVHELGHGTVFKTKALNAIFVRIFAFLGWINFELFNVSHARHHRYTLHAPDDLEVVLPLKVLVRHFFQQGFVHPQGLFIAVRYAARVACGRLRGEWELTLFPEDGKERRAPIRWARIMLAGHALIIAVSLYFHLWLVPVVVTLAPFYGGWLFFLCNNTQHIGLRDDVPDFRLCCRTFTLNPLAEFLYWHMNYHTEHHMYAAVPCYRLGRLHRLIKHDLPPCPHGLLATWSEIAAIQAIQKTNPDYQHHAPLPAAS
jgi:fatty acid desaturase